MPETTVKDTPAVETPASPELAPIILDDALVGKPLQLTLELGSDEMLWSAVLLRGRDKKVISRGVIPAGYGEPEMLKRWFEHYWQTLGSKRNRILLHISGPEILHRCFMIPVVPRSELSAVIRSHARRVFPFDIDDALFDWKLIGRVEWAGGPKFEISSQALGEHWRGWLEDFFGEYASNVELISSSGLYFEHLLGDIDPEFQGEDSYLIRLKQNRLETGFFHLGNLEFFREAAIDSLDEEEFIDQMRGIVNIGDDTEDFAGEAAEEIRSVVRDALDYYSGQFGQRAIKVAYLCMPKLVFNHVADFLQSHLNCRVVNLCDTEHVSSHRRLCGVRTDIEDYPRWVLVLPCSTRSKSRVDLSPEQVKKQRKEKRYFRRLLALSIIVLLVPGVMSIYEQVVIGSLQGQLDQSADIVPQQEADVQLSEITLNQARLEELKANLSIMGGDKDHGMVQLFKLLSHLSRPEVRLNRVEMSGSGDGENMIMKISGIVDAPPERQEPLLFGYVTRLEENPLVRSVAIEQKREMARSQGEQTEFELQVVAVK